MFEIPIFPLNTVIFPGIPLALHIFEPRYKLMVQRCIEQKTPFGVILIKKGQEALGPVAEPFNVGCSAQIIQVERLQAGRMNIATVGMNRFRVHSFDQSGAYLVGKVELFPLDDSDAVLNRQAASELRPWVKRYLEKIVKPGEDAIEGKHLPRDPLALAYMSAFVLQVPSRDKQELLEAPSADLLLRQLLHIFQREMALIDFLTMEESKLERGFGLN